MITKTSTALLHRDTFDANSSAQYTQFADTNSTWTWNTAQSRLETSGPTGAQAHMIYNAITAQDGFVEIDITRAEDAGVILRFVDQSNWYLARFQDASSPISPGMIHIYRRNAGVISVLWEGTFPVWTRGQLRRFTFGVVGTDLYLYINGKLIIKIAGGAPVANGKFGMRTGNLIQHFQAFRIYNTYTPTKVTGVPVGALVEIQNSANVAIASARAALNGEAHVHTIGMVVENAAKLVVKDGAGTVIDSFTPVGGIIETGSVYNTDVVTLPNLARSTPGTKVLDWLQYDNPSRPFWFGGLGNPDLRLFDIAFVANLSQGLVNDRWQFNNQTGVAYPALHKQVVARNKALIFARLRQANNSIRYTGLVGYGTTTNHINAVPQSMIAFYIQITGVEGASVYEYVNGGTTFRGGSTNVGASRLFNTDYTFTAALDAGVLRWREHANNVTVTPTNAVAALNGQAGVLAGSGAIVQVSTFILCPDRFVFVTGVPVGGSVEVQNAASVVLASANEAGGNASVPMHEIADLTLATKLVVKNPGGSTHMTYTAAIDEFIEPGETYIVPVLVLDPPGDWIAPVLAEEIPNVEPYTFQFEESPSNPDEYEMEESLDGIVWNPVDTFVPIVFGGIVNYEQQMAGVLSSVGVQRRVRALKVGFDPSDWSYSPFFDIVTVQLDPPGPFTAPLDGEIIFNKAPAYTYEWGAAPLFDEYEVRRAENGIYIDLGNVAIEQLFEDLHNIAPNNNTWVEVRAIKEFYIPSIWIASGQFDIIVPVLEPIEEIINPNGGSYPNDGSITYEWTEPVFGEYVTIERWNGSTMVPVATVLADQTSFTEDLNGATPLADSFICLVVHAEGYGSSEATCSIPFAITGPPVPPAPPTLHDLYWHAFRIDRKLGEPHQMTLEQFAYLVEFNPAVIKIEATNKQTGYTGYLLDAPDGQYVIRGPTFPAPHRKTHKWVARLTVAKRTTPPYTLEEL